MNIFAILFAVETLLVFVGLVDCTLVSMTFYAITFVGALLTWSENKNKTTIKRR